MHPVVADLQVADTAALALGLFHLDQHPVAVLTQFAQFIEGRCVAAGNHTPVTQQHRRHVLDGGLQQGMGVGMDAKLRGQLPNQRIALGDQQGIKLGQQCQAVAQAGQVAWTRRLECNT